MNISELKEKIKSADIGGGYIFGGEEDYLKRFYLGELRAIAVPDEAFSVFNHVVFDGEDVDFPALREAISSPPMFGDFKLIEWRYADFNRMREGERERLLELADFVRKYPYAVLVFILTEEGYDMGTVKRPSKLAKRYGEAFNQVNFEKSTDAQLASWLRRHFDSQGIAVTYGAISALIFRAGHGMQILKNEVEKLSAYAKANGLDGITEREVELVSSSTPECEAFALSGAITDKNRAAAFTALSDMKMRRVESAVVLAMICRAFGELVTVSMLIDEGKRPSDIESFLGWNSYKIKLSINSARSWGTKRLSEALGRLRLLESMSKSGGISGYAPIEMFIAEYL